MGQVQAAGGQRSSQDALVVNGDDAVDPAPAGQGHDGVGGRVRAPQVDLEEPVLHRLGQHLRALRGHHHLGAHLGGGVEKVGGPVGGGRKDQEQAGHGPIMFLCPGRGPGLNEPTTSQARVPSGVRI